MMECLRLHVARLYPHNSGCYEQGLLRHCRSDPRQKFESMISHIEIEIFIA
jgi:hypothetical protein